MKVETKKVPIHQGGMSLIGVGNERPCSWGNYFGLIIENKEVRVLNMWWENLEHAHKEYLKGDDVQIRLYSQGDGSHTRRWCLIDDERIPKNYYYNKLCFTGFGGGTSKEVARDMYDYLGDPDYEFERFVDPVSYYKKRGGDYNPETGIVSYRSRK